MDLPVRCRAFTLHCCFPSTLGTSLSIRLVAASAVVVARANPLSSRDKGGDDEPPRESDQVDARFTL